MANTNTLSEDQPQLDILDEYEVDQDNCSHDEIKDSFHSKYQVYKKTRLSESFQNSKTCVNLVANADEKTLAIANKISEVSLVDVMSAKRTSTFLAHSEELTGLTFCPKDGNLLYSCSADETVKVWDLRSSTSVHSFEYSEDNKMNFTCVDVNCTGDFICAGTTFREDSAHLMFWDVRNNRKCLGGYSESHSDDITHVKFHPKERQKLASAAMDNLINVYDISKRSEEHAYSQCIDFDTTPDCIEWDLHPDHSSKLFVINYPQLVQYWDIDQTKPTADLSAKRLCKSIKRQRPDQCHIISLNFDKYFNPMLMVASNLGCVSQENACIRTVVYERENKKLKPESTMEIKSSKPVQVLDSVYLPTAETYVTLETEGIQFWGLRGQKRTTIDDTDKSVKKLKI